MGREENDRGNHFMINLHESMGTAGIELVITGSAIRLASVARHVTDCATWPDLYYVCHAVYDPLHNLVVCVTCIHLLKRLLYNTVSLTLHSCGGQSWGLYLIWAPLTALPGLPIRYSPIGCVPSHHSSIPLRCDSGITCIIRKTLKLSTHRNMGESSKFQKSWTLENQLSKLALCLTNINNFQFKWSIVTRESKNKWEMLLESAKFSILRLTFYGKTAPKSWIQE